MNNVIQLQEPRKSTRKQVEVSPAMLEQINAIADADLTAEEVVVFEATAAGTAPISKVGSIWNEARITRATLEEMALKLNTKAESVPLHTLHLQGDELPVGRVFNGFLNDTEMGETELRVHFYLPKSEAAMIEKINLGIVDETSIGMQPQAMLCSECGWDYRGDEADFDNFWDRTCLNGHTIGESGHHLILAGVEHWTELSLVSRGASRNAKIHGRAKAQMSQEQTERLAASGLNPGHVTLFASPTKEKEPMAKDPAVTVPNPEAAAVFDAEASFTALTASVEAITALLTAKEEPEVVDPAVALQEQIDALTAENENLKATAALKEDLPAGGVALDAVSDAPAKPRPVSFAAFKTPSK